MISSKPNAIVYFRRSDLIIAGRHISPAKLNLGQDLINNLEIKDPSKFIATCQVFFSSHSLSGKRVLLVLDSSVVFSKSLEQDGASKEAVSAAADAFVEAMPFEQGQRACLELLEDGYPQLYATNADLYTALQEALRASDVKKVVAIAPVGAYNLEHGIKPAAAIDRYMSDKKVYKTADFSTATPV
jgi:hypothetical protein